MEIFYPFIYKMYLKYLDTLQIEFFISKQRSLYQRKKIYIHIDSGL